MNIRHILGIGVIFAGLLLGVSCSKQSEQAQEDAADIEAAQIEGREAARVFVNRVWKDTMELQKQLLSARAQSSKYEMAGKPRAKEAYDSAFVSTLRTVRPEVARHLKK